MGAWTRVASNSQFKDVLWEYRHHTFSPGDILDEFDSAYISLRGPCGGETQDSVPS